MEKDQLARKLAVILHADIVGSTTMVQKSETIAHERIQAAFRRLSESVESYSGTTRELRGDALVAEFDRASDAVSAAFAFQHRNGEANALLDDDIQPHMRIGISLGEVVIADHTVTGAGVVLAQRLEQLAKAGAVVVQGAVADTVPTRMPFQFISLGEQQLKGFEKPVRAFAVELQQNEPLPSPEGRTTPRRSDTNGLTLPDKPSIAVLPFTNMSGDAEQEYFSDGITEDIITELSRFAGLFVIARNSSFAFKNQSFDVRTVARELGVRYMLEGSVRRAGNRLRITAQLLDTEQASHIWAERYDGEPDDIFDLQDEITRKIVGSIAPQIEMAEVERSRRLPASNLTSYELSLRAQAIFHDCAREGTPELREQTLEAAQAALDLDPRNTHALWIMGYTCAMQYLYRWGDDPESSLARARDIAERFLQADSTNPRAFMIRAMTSIFGRDFDAAIADYRHAFSLNPNFALNAMFMAWGESLAGLTTEAKEHAELALRLSPRDLDLWLGDAYLALLQASFAEADFEAAKKWGALAIQMTPKAPIRRALMIAACIYTGDPDGAARHAEQLKSFAPDFIPSILQQSMTLYKMPEHNSLLLEGLRKAGFN